jgi:hypothetical protein
MAAKQATPPAEPGFGDGAWRGTVRCKGSSFVRFAFDVADGRF